RLNPINEELTTTMIRNAAAKARNDAIIALQQGQTSDAVARSSLVPTQLSTTVQQPMMKVCELRSECADLEERALEKHPRLISCRQRLQTAEDSLKHEIDAALATSRAEYNDVLATERNLLGDLNATKADAIAAIDFEPEFLKL